MRDGAQKDYRFGPKNNWRRTVWNEVLRRTDGREKTMPILYLSGVEGQHSGRRSAEMARKIAAMLAVRTKRMAS